MSNRGTLEKPISVAESRLEQLERRSIEAVLTGTTWLSEHEMREEFGSGSIADQATIDEWVKAGQLFAIEVDGRRLVPIYAFNTSGTPLPALKDVISVLSGFSSWRLAAWFESTSSMLGGGRPRELVALDPHAVLASARSHKEGPQHG
jgi:hypothetical protein